MKNKIRALSPAKINLFLKVLRKRKDGFHQILSWMQAVGLQDEIEIVKIPEGIRVVCNNFKVPTDRRNLAYQAAELFLRQTKLKTGVRIRIRKRIPMGAGLGGGSSNAAVILLGLQKLFNRKLKATQLSTMAKKLGSDVLFFLSSGSALAGGRGESLQDVKLPVNYWMVLVNPGFEVSTKWAYSKVKPKPLNRRLLSSRSRATLNAMLKEIKTLGNDLQGVVVKHYPEVKRIIDELNESGALYSAMSGSGPTVFGIFRNKPTAERISRKLKNKRGRKAWVVRPLRLKSAGLPL